MAPQKTMAVSQQQQQQQQQLQQQQQQQQSPRRANLGEQTAKSKRRKGKQSSAAQHQHLQQQLKVPLVEKQEVRDEEKSPTSNNSNNKDSLARKPLVEQNSLEESELDKLPPTSELTRKNLQVHSSRESFNLNSGVLAAGKNKSRISATSAVHTVLAKQISTEEQDDIDAGIELDGSSNSGSSVKDLNEDQVKSASVSPIMAQSNLVNENRSNTATKHAAENSSIEQLAGSLCHDIALSKKIGLTTKQQLAANQQVIDADERSLQQKLQSKQRKSSVQGNASNSTATTAAASSTSRLLQNGNGSNGGGVGLQQQNGASPPSPALCKVCEQHVYQMERMMAEKAVYHKSCFRCYQCKTQLRVDNYASHEGQVYCKAHHRQIFQPQVKLDNEDDVDIVAKSTEKVVDDYLLHRGRLSDLSFSFLQPKPEGIRKRQMIICENEPAELPKDVVRSDTKVDDGIDRLSLNLGNIKERFERGATGNCESSVQSPSSAALEMPSFNLKKTLMAFETKTANQNDNEDGDRVERVERPVVKKLTNLNGFLNRQSSGESDAALTTPPTTLKPLAVRRSESLMMRLKKYESRIAGVQVADDDDSGAEDDENNNNETTTTTTSNVDSVVKSVKSSSNNVPKKLASIDLSSLKNQWENGDISRRRYNHADDDDDPATAGSDGKATGDNSPSTEKDEELIRVRQQLARKKSGSGSSSIKNIYENAIKEAQLQRTQTSKLNSSDLSALNGFSTTEIQQQLLQNGSQNNRQSSTPSATPNNKDHFQLNLSNKANKLRQRFEQGLINNSSYDDDSDANEDDPEQRPALSKLEQLRQEKLEDLNWLANKHEGELQAREARNMFQQIDRRLSNGQQQSSGLAPSSRSLSSISASMQAKLQQNQQQSIQTKNQSFDSDRGANENDARAGGHLKYEQQQHQQRATAAERQKPSRMTTFQ